MIEQMKPRTIFTLAALGLCQLLAAQAPAPEWQPDVERLKTLLQEDPAGAEALSDELLKGKNRKNVPLLTAVGRLYLEAEKPAEAEELLALARKAEPRHPQVSLLEGDLALSRREVGRACQLYEQAIYFDPACCEAYLKYAAAYRTAAPEQAIGKLQQLKTVLPDCPEADRALAEIYYANNRFDEAVRAYAAFIDTPVATDEDLLKYAFALFLAHDFEQSLAVVQRGLEQSGRRAPLHRLAMYCYTDLQRYDEALQAAEHFFRNVEQGDVSYLDYRYYGTLLRALGRYDDAVHAFGNALLADEGQAEVWRELADTYEQAGRYAPAIAAYRNYCDRLPPAERTAEQLFQLGRLYYAEGNATDTLAQASPEQPDTLSPRHREALMQADSLFALVAGQAPDSHVGPLWRARTHASLDPETTQGLAKPYYEEVLALLLPRAGEAKYRAPLVECYSYLGYYYLLQNDYPASREYWNKILALDPDNPTAKRALEGIP